MTTTSLRLKFYVPCSKFQESTSNLKPQTSNRILRRYSHTPIHALPIPFIPFIPVIHAALRRIGIFFASLACLSDHAKGVRTGVRLPLPQLQEYKMDSGSLSSRVRNDDLRFFQSRITAFSLHTTRYTLHCLPLLLDSPSSIRYKQNILFTTSKTFRGAL